MAAAASDSESVKGDEAAPTASTSAVGPTASTAPAQDDNNAVGMGEEIDWLALLAIPPAAEPSYIWPMDMTFPTFPQPPADDTAMMGNRLMSALEAQNINVRRDPSNEEDLQLYYYRFVSA